MSNLRNIKDTVFTSLFKDKAKVLELYRVLHPEDTTVTVDDIEIMTINPVLFGGLHNDLSFMVRGEKIIFVEAQSSYNPNMPLRLLFYFSEVMRILFFDDKNGSGVKVNIYGEQRVTLPSPEFYVIYTGKRHSEETLSLDDLFNTQTDSKLNLEVKVLQTGNDDDIVSQYIKFCNIANAKITEHTVKIKVSGSTKRMTDFEKAAEETVESCIQEEILKEFMIQRKGELITMLSVLFSEEYERKMREEDAEARGEEKTLEAVSRIMQGIRGGLSDIDISRACKIDMKKVQRIRADMGWQ